MVNLSVEHVLLFVVLAFLLYRLMGGCGCRNGFRVGGPPRSVPAMCATCAGDLIASVGTLAGIDEIPLIGEGVMGSELGVAAVSCGLCGINVGETFGCLKANIDKPGNMNDKLCQCESKLCLDRK